MTRGTSMLSPAAQSVDDAATDGCIEPADREWIPVCGYANLLPERGAAALVGMQQVAIFRTFDGTVHAIANQDPFSGAFVLSRGIVGSRDNTPTIASPMHKQTFDLRTGRCLDDPETSVAVYPVRVRDGTIEVMVH